MSDTAAGQASTRCAECDDARRSPGSPLVWVRVWPPGANVRHADTALWTKLMCAVCVDDVERAVAPGYGWRRQLAALPARPTTEGE